jgi:hypothetical protein
MMKGSGANLSKGASRVGRRPRHVDRCRVFVEYSSRWEILSATSEDVNYFELQLARFRHTP